MNSTPCSAQISWCTCVMKRSVSSSSPSCAAEVQCLVRDQQTGALALFWGMPCRKYSA